MERFESQKQETAPLETGETSSTRELMLAAREALKRQMLSIAEKNLKTRQGSGRVPLVPKLGENNPDFDAAEEDFKRVYGEGFYDEMRLIGDEIESELGIKPEK